MNTQDERKAFESNIAISEMLKDTGIEFSLDKNEYFHSMYSTFVPEDIHFLNGAWWMFQVQYKKLEGCVVVPVEYLNKTIDALESIFKDDQTLALGELLPIQQDIKAMLEAERSQS